MRGVAASLAVALALLALAACGDGDDAEPGAPEGATLVLDFQPNSVHAPLYAAQAHGYFEEEGIDLGIREPSSTADAAKLLAAGRADFAILDINDLGIARERDLGIVAVAALVQRPLAAVIAADPEAVPTPSALDGKSVGVTGVPSDDAVLDTVLDSAGLAPDAVDRVTIGFAAVPSLAAGKVDAATAFWNAEGVELRHQGIAIEEFRVDEYGAPRYPELVIAARGEGVPVNERATCGLLLGLNKAYIDLADDPQAVIEDMLGEVDGLDDDSQEAQFAELIAADAFSPVDEEPPNPAISEPAVRAWVVWATEQGILNPRLALDLPRSFRPDEIRRCATTPRT